MKRIWIPIIIVVVAVIAMFRFLKPEKPEIEATDQTEVSKPVEITKAKRGEIRSELQLSGTIEAQSRVSVVPKIAGRIINLPVTEGTRVKKGVTLAVIEHEELKLAVEQAAATLESAESAYSQAQQLAEVRVHSQVAQAKALLNAAEVSMQQVKELAEIRTVTQIDQAEAGLKSLIANLEKIKTGARDEDRRQAEAGLNQAKANLLNAQNNYARMEQLFKNGAISQQSLENSQTQLDVVKAQHKIATEQLQLIDNGAREEDIQAMAAQVEQAKAGLRLAQAQASTKTWEKDIALAQSQVETARAGFTSAHALEKAKSWEAEITAAKTARTQADIALELAKKRLRDATIKAPIDGIVSQRFLDLGGMAVPTAPLFEIVDIDTVKASADVIEAHLSQLTLAQQAVINIDGINTPISGKIAYISPTLQPMQRTARVEIHIDNPEGTLKPGMFAKVTVPVEVRTGTILVPRVSLIEDTDTKTQNVFVVEAGVSQRRPVEIGLSRGGEVEIVSGLNEGDSVVIAGQHSLKVGESVTVVSP